MILETRAAPDLQSWQSRFRCPICRVCSLWYADPADARRIRDIHLLAVHATTPNTERSCDYGWLREAKQPVVSALGVRCAKG